MFCPSGAVGREFEEIGRVMEIPFANCPIRHPYGPDVTVSRRAPVQVPSPIMVVTSSLRIARTASAAGVDGVPSGRHNMSFRLIPGVVRSWTVIRGLPLDDHSAAWGSMVAAIPARAAPLNVGR